MDSLIPLMGGRGRGRKKPGIWVARDIWAIGLFYLNGKYKECNVFLLKLNFTEKYCEHTPHLALVFHFIKDLARILSPTHGFFFPPSDTLVIY